MAKHSSTTAAQDMAAPPKAPLAAPPKGYAKHDVNIVGYWMPEYGPIHGVLKSAHRFKNRLGRWTIVYVFRIVEPCAISVSLDGGGYDIDQAKYGEYVGVFGSGFLTRPLSELRDALVWLQRLDKVVIKGGNTMWRFDIAVDPRREGKPLDVPEVQPRNEASEASEDLNAADNIPF